MFTIKEGTPADKIGEGTSKEVLESINKFLESQGFTIRNKEDEESFVASVGDKKIDEGYGKAMTEVEKTIEEITGQKKSDRSEKATEYIKRVMKDEDATQKITDLQKKIEEYEEKGVDGNEKAEEYKKQLTDLQKKYKDQREEYEQKLTDQSKSIFDSKVKQEVSQQMSAIRAGLDKNIAPELLEDIVENRLNKFYKENQAAESDGMIVFKDENGTTKISKKDGKPMNSKELLTGYFEDITDKTRRQNGSGSGQGEGGEGGEGKTYTKPENVKTKVELHSYLTKSKDEEGLGLDASSKEFAEAYNELGEGLPLR